MNIISRYFSFLLLSFTLFACSHDESSQEQKAAAAAAKKLYADEVAEAANQLIDIIPPDQRRSLVYPFDSDSRVYGKDTTQTPSFCAVLAWCLPGWGLQQSDMNHDQLVAMHKLFNLALSSGGYQTLLAVLNRQRIIGEMEEKGDTQFLKDVLHKHPHAHEHSVFDFDHSHIPDSSFYPAVAGGYANGEVKWVWDSVPGLAKRREQFDEYTLAIFGTPGRNTEWGFRFEGHHITFNMTFITDQKTGEVDIHTTPLFFGAFPMIIPESPEASKISQEWGWEEGQIMMYSVAHHLRKFWINLPEATRSRAFIDSSYFTQSPPIILDTPMPFMIGSLDPRVDSLKIDKYPHLKVSPSELSSEAKWHLKQAYQFYVNAMNSNLSPDYIERIDEALDAREQLTLSWAGQSLQQEGSHHYSYLLVDNLLLEFMQSNQFSIQHDPSVTGNHVHSMLRDLKFDWLDPMSLHLRRSH